MIKMNQKKWIPIVLAMLTLGACSDDEVSDNGNGPQWNTAGKGYISLSLNLPTTGPNSKAENFEGGDESEYDVKDAKLLIFTGKKDNGDVSNMKFHSAYNLDLSGWDKNENSGQITTTSTKITQEINSYQSEDVEAYALVVLNSDGIITVKEDDKTATINGTELTKSKTWGEVQTIVLSGKTLTENGILMLNAPLASIAGGTSDPTGAECTTLAPILKSRIYGSPEAASTGLPAAIVYAERVVAKVSVSVDPELKEATLTDQNKVPCEVTGWVLDNTNTVSYLGHVIDRNWFPLYSRAVPEGSPDYRFVGSTALAGGGTAETRNLYRCYWAIDPNYYKTPENEIENETENGAETRSDLGTESGNFNTVTSVSDIKEWKKKDAFAYCFENTFDIEQMRNDQMTRAIVQVQFNNGVTFYTINDDASSILSPENLNEELKKNLKQLSRFDSWLEENSLTEEDEYQFSFTDATDAKGQKVVSSIQVGTQSVPEDFLSDLNKRNKIKEYLKGNAYYPVLIKHFGDSQTPWGTWEDGVDNPKPATNAVYPGKNAAANYLGRYGVVRNNWYQLNITSINKLGYPDVPPIENEPADNMDAYISVEINVLSWAKRTQDVKL